MEYARPILLLIIAAVLATCGAPGSETVPLSDVPETVPVEADPLFGTWRRLSYPHGSIQVKPDSLKFAVGEGLAEPARFQAYRVTDTCPFVRAVPPRPTGVQYLVTPDNESCSAFTLSGDTLMMYYPPGNEAVTYVRE
ncbi:hypothetical protein [Lewinella sp. IMCC34191]|uniref:hypothetical protein n=1 Tax=Lewinella sp. IMCC34191 TaxID=2259172 RepID=UPI000E26D73C|nr:hypothetical protein [Lewinella sp. IMCC34191]